MRRSIWLALAITLMASVGVGLLAIGRGPEWTTTSPEALAEFRVAEQARSKLYYADAAVHLQRTLELDPDFLVAKLYLIELGGHLSEDSKKQLLDEILEADLSDLTPREQFLAKRMRALIEKRYDLANELLDAYLERNPDDPYVLEIKAQDAFKRSDLATAESFALRCLEVNPNWARGYNLLGYITMQQGRFSEADEYFTSYRFIAPDQANPHDSLGELYMIRGRYDEAVASFERAFEIKPDFPGSYAHLVGAHLLRGDYTAAEESIRRTEESQIFGEGVIRYLECTAHYNELAHRGVWQQILDERESSCFQEASFTHAAFLLTHRAAVERGKLELARQLEQRAAEQHEEHKKHKKSSVYGLDIGAAARLHMEGVRLLAEQEYDTAVARLSEADAALSYRESGIALFKLLNRMMLVEALRGAGKEQDAQSLEWNVHEINPSLAQHYRDQALVALTLTF